ncbi:ClpXP protease specificity-enhancing factor SspB [Thaumasiovibrio subtropicus]|uniref:ClpXP protease specificity-enhancing factor SspB n=1 Tax=Thaumasiovibrio subtropicus TaxID=1891207 RepID=UPI000B35A40E|nr:ClpXP protease specificity-enhancing factor SspB [Thaumasiovibrio subtropicus]
MDISVVLVIAFVVISTFLPALITGLDKYRVKRAIYKLPSEKEEVREFQLAYKRILQDRHIPHLLIDANHKQVVVPSDYVKNGEVTLNVSPSAIHGFELICDCFVFMTRRGNNNYQVRVPIEAIKALYAFETGEGIKYARYL